MDKPFLLIFDHGTTGVRASVMDRDGRIYARGYRKLPQQYPQPGWVEQDALEMWELTRIVAEEALASGHIGWGQIHAIGLTNQRETTILWDVETGEPVHPAIVWQCRRTAGLCEILKDKGLAASIGEKTGLVADAYFSATKIQWLLESIPQAQTLAHQGRLRFGTVDTWILWKLSGGKVHATDTTNASRTLLFNIHTRQWDPELLALFNVPQTLLPEVRHSSAHFGETDPSFTGGIAIPMAGVIGDQQSSLYGQKCWEPGEAKSTYGTGAFLVMNLGDEPILSKSGLLTTLACDAAGEPAYALEGAIFTAGATMEWLQNSLGLVAAPTEFDPLARSLPDNEGVYLVPAFAGLGAPYWDPTARAAISGLTQGSTRAHLIRAGLEAMAYQTREVMDLMQQEGQAPLKALRVDGGVTRSEFLMQFLADMLAVPVLRTQEAETTTQGAGYLAGLATGFWQSPEAIRRLPEQLQTFTPAMPAAERARLYDGWMEAVGKVKTSPKTALSV